MTSSRHSAPDAPAYYIGTQDGYRHLPALELYTLLEPVGEHPTGSTVSRFTLEQHGFSLRLIQPVAANESRPDHCAA